MKQLIDYINEVKFGANNENNYIDLALPSKTKWAKYNIGANKIEEYGDYYKWGETVPMTKWEGEENYKKPIDKGSLPAELDIATKTLGNDWSMPTAEDFEELMNNTNYEVVRDYNRAGVNGYLFKSKKNKQELFLPLSGMFDEEDEPDQLNISAVYYCKDTSSTSKKKYHEINTFLIYNFNKPEIISSSYGYYGCSIRPVKHKK